jgi:alcohol dehydrogenase
LLLKSTFHGSSNLNLTMVVVDEVQLIGSRCGPFAPALRLLERGLVETAPLMSGRFPLAQALTAFEAAQGQLKILLEVPR